MTRLALLAVAAFCVYVIVGAVITSVVPGWLVVVCLLSLVWAFSALCCLPPSRRRR